MHLFGKESAESETEFVVSDVVVSRQAVRDEVELSAYVLAV